MSWSRKSEYGWKTTLFRLATGELTGPEGVPVAVATAEDAEEQALAGPRLRGHRPPRRRREQAHEVGEGHDARAVVVELREGVAGQEGAVAARTVLVGELRARDAHLVQVRVTGELVQGRHLILPAEPTHRGAVPGDVVHHGHSPRLVRRRAHARSARCSGRCSRGQRPPGPGRRAAWSSGRETRVACDGTRLPGEVAACRPAPIPLTWISDPPCSGNPVNFPSAPTAPKRVSTRALLPPTAGSEWHRAHDVSLNTGPSPSSAVSSSSNSSFPASKRASSPRSTPAAAPRGAPARARAARCSRT